MLFLTIEEVIVLHKMIIDRTGGSHGIRDLGALQSSLTQPLMTFGGQELYPGLAEKAAILGFLLITNHPFIDGNKRIGYVVMETFLVVNGQELILDIEDQEAVIIRVAAGELNKEDFTNWVKTKIVTISA